MATLNTISPFEIHKKLKQTMLSLLFINNQTVWQQYDLSPPRNSQKAAASSHRLLYNYPAYLHKTNKQTMLQYTNPRVCMWRSAILMCACIFRVNPRVCYTATVPLYCLWVIRICCRRVSWDILLSAISMRARRGKSAFNRLRPVPLERLCYYKCI